MSQIHNSDPDKESLDQIDQQVEQELAEALKGGTIDQLLDQPSDTAPAPPASSVGDTAPSVDAGGAAAPAGPQPPPRRQAQVAYQIARGRIASIEGDDVFVDLHGDLGKHQGMVPLSQFDRAPRPGSIMDFVVERKDESQGLVILSREGAVSHETWENIRPGSVVEARVLGTNKGGLELELVGRIRAFMPASQIDLHHVEDLESFVGQTLKAIVHDVNRSKKSIVLSHRSFLQAQRETQRRELWGKLEPDQVREGTVTSVTDYGAFVDIGGIDGLVHVSQMSYQRVAKPNDVVKIGDKVSVKVLSIDQEKQRVSLSLKQVTPDPWQGIAERLHTGEQVSARVVRTTDFGAFLEIEPGVEGLLPVSEMSWQHVKHTTDVVKVGDVIRVAVIQIDPEKNRVSLSLKQTEQDPWINAVEKYPKDTVTEAKILGTTEFGAFAELESGVEGLIHISELADRRVGAVEDVVQVGQTHKVRVLEVDQDTRRIRLSIKAVDRPAPSTGDAKPSGPDRARTRPKSTKPLKGGMGQSGALGMGLGDLKL